MTGSIEIIGILPPDASGRLRLTDRRSWSVPADQEAALREALLSEDLPAGPEQLENANLISRTMPALALLKHLGTEEQIEDFNALFGQGAREFAVSVTVEPDTSPDGP